MAAVTTPFPTGAKIQVPLWAILIAVFAIWVSYVVLQENGLMTDSWMRIHEFFHDGRHALGFPCH